MVFLTIMEVLQTVSFEIEVKNFISDQNMKRFEIKPPPSSYLRLYLPFVNAAVVVPYDTAGNDIYKLLYYLATGTGWGCIAPRNAVFF